jgi:hypothetical protein
MTVAILIQVTLHSQAPSTRVHRQNTDTRYLAANATHPERCRTQCQASAPRHDFPGSSSPELTPACAASADLAAQRQGSPARTPSSRCCVRGDADAPGSCTQPASSKERRRKLAPGSRECSASSRRVTGGRHGCTVDGRRVALCKICTVSSMQYSATLSTPADKGCTSIC